MIKDFYKGLMAAIIMFVVLCILIYDVNASPIKMNTLAYEHATKYLYVREAKNDNRSPEIDTWHKWHGLGYGNPYCQMFVNYMYNLAFQDVKQKNPLYRSARCSTFASWCLKNPLLVKTISAKQINMGAKLEVGDILNFKHGIGDSPGNFSYNGHAAMVKDPDTNIYPFTIEGNTKPSDKGDQTGRVMGDTKYGNDGVYVRHRKLGMGSSFPILFAFRLQKNIY